MEDFLPRGLEGLYGEYFARWISVEKGQESSGELAQPRPRPLFG